MSAYKGGSVAYRPADGRWVARVQVDGVRHTASQKGPDTAAGRRSAERMLRALVRTAHAGKGGRRPGSRVWPLEPLLDATGASRRTIAQVLGLTERTGQRWAHHEVTLTDAEADLAATRLGVHPAMVWASWIDVALA